MKQLFSVFLITFAFSSFPQSDSVLNQTLEKALTTKVPNCQDISLNAKRLIMEFYSKGRADSIALVINFLKSKCSAYYLNSKDDIILSSIINNSFSESLIDSTMFTNAMIHQLSSPDKENRWLFDFPVREGNKTLFDDYYKFKVSVFDSLSRTLDTSSVGYLLSLYYSAKYDSFYFKLRHSPAFAHSLLKQLYDRECNKVTFQSRLGVSLAYQQPMGNLNIFESRPEIGGYLGIRCGRFYGDLFGCFRLWNTKQQFNYVKNDSTFKNKVNKNYSFGLELGFETFQNYKNQFDLLFGVGFDYLSLKGIEKNLTNKEISTPYFSPGIGYRYYAGKHRLIIINPQIRFVFLDDINKDIASPDLPGNSIIFRVNIGISDHIEDINREYLRYYDMYYNIEKTGN